MLVLPGGGYREHTEHDGEGYARWLSTIGVHAFVLRYRLLPHRFPAPLQDARAGLDHVRRGEHGLAVDPQRVGVIGSSAGGHLAGLLLAGTVLSLENQSVEPPRPDFAVLAYALADLDLLPEEAVAALLGDLLPLKDELSPAATSTPGRARRSCGRPRKTRPACSTRSPGHRPSPPPARPSSCTSTPRGGHGVGLADGVRYGDHGATRIPHTAQWSRACEAWLREEGIL